jgi:hypothetical protein
MKKVRLWAVQKCDNGTLRASDVPDVDNTDTEELLESLLVQSPHLLMDGLTLVGRQVPTDGGPLDLLGVDEDGYLVIYELKRGSLTRDAVAQILDYESDIAEMDVDRLAKLIEHSSGQNGIDKIEDFQDWYAQTYPNRESVLEAPPRMVLVGLGVDRRALRIVNFLAKSGIQISLLTFNAFNRDGALFLARQVESVDPSSGPSNVASTSQTKESNLQALRANAAKLGVGDFIQQVADFIGQRIPAYRWPGKTTYAFSLTEHTDKGKPTLRVYVNLSLNWTKKGSLTLLLQDRAVRVLGEDSDLIATELKDRAKKNKWGQIEVTLTQETWPTLSATLEKLLTRLVDGWKAKTSSDERKEDGQQEGAGDSQ